MPLEVYWCEKLRDGYKEVKNESSIREETVLQIQYANKRFVTVKRKISSLHGLLSG